MKYAITQMKEQETLPSGERGWIINIGSIGSQVGLVLDHKNSPHSLPSWTKSDPHLHLTCFLLRKQRCSHKPHTPSGHRLRSPIKSTLTLSVQVSLAHGPTIPRKQRYQRDTGLAGTAAVSGHTRGCCESVACSDCDVANWMTSSFINVDREFCC